MVVVALSVILTLLPIVVIVLLMTWKQLAADLSGLAGWFLTFLIAILFFHTSVEVGLRASLAGFISSFPVSIMVLVSIFQITFMESTGAIKRITVFVKTLASSNKAVQIMLINVGAGTLLVSVGATPVSVLPPILLALGYSTFVAIALPALGFDALCTFSLLGAPLVVYSDLTGVPLVQAAQVFAAYLPVVSTLIGFGMLWIVGGTKLMKEGFFPCLLAGLTNGGVAVAMGYIPFLSSGVVLTGVIAGACTIMVMLLYLRVLGKPIIDRDKLTKEDLLTERSMSLVRALSPWLILVGALFVVNFYPPLHEFFFKQMEMAVSVIPGQIIKTRMLWNAYTWVLVSTVVAAIFLKPTGNQVKYTINKGLKRALRPAFSAAIFFAIGFVMNNTGLENVAGKWQVVNPDYNMIWVLAQGSAEYFGSLYPLVTAPLGLFGGFISGSEASTVAMFAKYNLITSDLLKVNPLIVTAATAIGGGLASVISPAKLQNAAATIDALGEETKVIKTAFVISLVITAVTAVLCFLMA
ncbi:MAG: L-lactate permease [Dehalobacterium sp.]